MLYSVATRRVDLLRGRGLRAVLLQHRDGQTGENADGKDALLPVLGNPSIMTPRTPCSLLGNPSIMTPRTPSSLLGNPSIMTPRTPSSLLADGGIMTPSLLKGASHQLCVMSC